MKISEFFISLFDYLECGTDSTSTPYMCGEIGGVEFYKEITMEEYKSLEMFLEGKQDGQDN